MILKNAASSQRLRPRDGYVGGVCALREDLMLFAYQFTYANADTETI